MATVKPLLFSGPVESGLRALILLFEGHPVGIDLQRLVTFDYLLVHSADVLDGPPSIHPASPLRGGEVAVRRGLVEDGLRLYARRGLIHRHATESGFQYEADDASATFLDSFDGGYISLLRERAAWVIGRFARLAANELALVVNESIGRWRSEFVSFEDADD